MTNQEENRPPLYRLLNWSERYIQTDMVYLTRGGLWLTVSQVITALVGLILSIAFANLLPKEVFGTYRYVISIMGLLSIPTLEGMGTAVLQSTSRGYEGSLKESVKVKLRWGILAGIGAIIFGTYYISNTPLAFSFFATAIFLPFMYAFWVYDSFLLGKKEFKYSAKINIIIQLIYLAVLLSAILFLKESAYMIAIYCIFWTAIRYVYYKIILKKFVTNTEVDKTMVSYGKHLSFMGILATISNYLDQILIFNLLGPIFVATYSIAMAPINQILGLLKNVKSITLPKFAERDIFSIKKTYWKKFSMLILILSFVSIIYSVSASLIYKFLFPQYLDAARYSQILSLSIIGQASIINIAVLQSQKKKRELYQQTVFASLNKIVLISIGIFMFGINGLIVGFVLSKLAECAYSTWIVYKLEN